MRHNHTYIYIYVDTLNAHILTHNCARVYTQTHGHLRTQCPTLRTASQNPQNKRAGAAHPGVRCNFLRLFTPEVSCIAFVYRNPRHKTTVSCGSYFMLWASYKTRYKKRKCVRMAFFYVIHDRLWASRNRNSE